MRFKLRQMEVFRAVMITGSVSGAARMLYVSQPAVSKLLGHTERSLGIKLFHRVGGKLVPTTDAVNLFAEVRHVFEAAQKVDSFVENLAAQPGGAINLCSSPSLALNVVPRVTAAFLRRYPDTKIHFHTALIRDIPVELLSGKADLAITVLPVDNPSLNIEPLMHGRMVCALPKGHPMTRFKRLAIADLVGQRLILYSRGIPFGELTLAAIERSGCHIAPAIDVPRAELACALVRQGLGIAIVDEFCVADGMWKGVEVRPLVEDIPVAVSLIRSKFDRPSTEVERFIDVLRAEVAAFR